MQQPLVGRLTAGVRLWLSRRSPVTDLAGAFVVGPAAFLPARTMATRSCDRRKTVVVSGCDTGLGFNIARYCLRSGLTVFAGCLDVNSAGAQQLRDSEWNDAVTILPLNLRQRETISSAAATVEKFLASQPDHQLFAVINNAGIMCFGEFEWQTDALLEEQIGINLLGTMLLTKSFLPALRRHRSRLINVTSHCSLQALPGLAPYAATKAALRFWTDGIRIELAQYGIEVVSFIPGSMVMSTGIGSRQQCYRDEMRREFTDEQRAFYGEYFERYQTYLQFLTMANPIEPLDDNNPVMVKFARALLDASPKAMYVCAPLRYEIYHTLFLWTPQPVRDWLVRKFMMMPEYKQDGK